MIISENKYLVFDKAKKVDFKYCVKKILHLFDSFYYKLLFNFFVPKRIESPRYKVSLCSIFKDEGDYLKQWIEFHRIVGVEHFYLYNNNSSDNYRVILQGYIDEGIVTLIDWPIKQGQLAAYSDFMEKYRGETEWVGFIDLDEYIIPNENNTIYDFLKPFAKRPSVVIYWKYFGSSGYLERNISGLLIEDFTIAWEKFENLGKFFFNTKYTYCPDYKKNGTVHYMWAKSGAIMLPPVNVFDKVCTYGFNDSKSKDLPIQINHYVIKSYMEYFEKKAKRGGGVHPIGMHDFDYFFHHEEKSIASDYHAYKYLIKLKLRMKNNSL